MDNARRQPIQERGKERYQLIITAAQKLVGERGNDQVSIRDIAKEAGVAPSSIYQYFDDKHAIIVAIMTAYFDRSFALLQQETEAVQTLDEWVQGIERSLEHFYHLLLDDPGWATIWSGIQASPALRELDNADAQRHARHLADHFIRLCPQAKLEQVVPACLLLVHTAGLTVRLALFSDAEEAQTLLLEFKQLLRLRVQALQTAG